jgi:hypothetical protein
MKAHHRPKNPVIDNVHNGGFGLPMAFNDRGLAALDSFEDLTRLPRQVGFGYILQKFHICTPVPGDKMCILRILRSGWSPVNRLIMLRGDDYQNIDLNCSLQEMRVR